MRNMIQSLLLKYYLINVTTFASRGVKRVDFYTN